MALFVLIIVGAVVALTWLDWRDTSKDWVVPEWAKGVALAAVVAASLTATLSFASVWIQDPAGEWGGAFHSSLFWPEFGFLLFAMGIIIAAVRKKRLRILLVLAGVLTIAFWLGMTLSS